MVGYPRGGLRGLDRTPYGGVGGPRAPCAPRTAAAPRPRGSRAVKPVGQPLLASSTSASTTSGNGTCLTRTSCPL